MASQGVGALSRPRCTRSIDTVPARNLIRIRLTGFWDAATFARFKIEAREAALSLACPPGSHRVIADATAAAIQSQQVTAQLLDYMKDKHFRLAFVTGNAVIKMQARRVFRETGVIVVDTVAEAEAALFGDR